MESQRSQCYPDVNASVYTYVCARRSALQVCSTKKPCYSSDIALVLLRDDLSLVADVPYYKVNDGSPTLGADGCIVGWGMGDFEAHM